MKKTTMTPEDIELLAEIRRRRSYHLACVWLEHQRDVVRKDNDRYLNDQWAKRHYWPRVAELCRLLEKGLYGFRPAVETLAVALRDTGYRVIRRKGELLTDFGGELDLSEQARCVEYEHRLGDALNLRFAKHSDVVIEATGMVH